MTSKRREIRHLFGGGWASDFGPSANVSPNQVGDVLIPFLTTADNVYFELDGGPHKIGGTSKVNSVVIESGASIRGLFDYWRQGTAGSPTQRRVVYASTKILADAADGTFSSIKTGLVDGRVPCFTVFNDNLVMSSDSGTDVPMTYDGTTVTTLDATGPNFSFSCVHKNRVWAAGVAGFPSRLYYSAQYDASKWDTDVAPDATCGHIDIDLSDGDRITGIKSHKNDLWVFKGPYKGSIHRITGSSNTGSDSFARIPFIRGIGAVSHNTLFTFRDDLGFMWSDGTIHSLAATAAYGDYNESALSRPIHRAIRESINHTFLAKASVATDVSRSLVFFALPINGSSVPNVVITMDFSRQNVWWATCSALQATCVAHVIDPTSTSQPIIMTGGADGYVRRTNLANRAIDSTTAISASVATPATNYGSASLMKTLANASIGIAPKGGYTATFGWTRDDNALQAIAINQGGGDVLGVASAHQFTLGTSALAGAQFVERFTELGEVGGEFRSISYSLFNSGVNEDLEVHSISASIEIGAQSTEI